MSDRRRRRAVTSTAAQVSEAATFSSRSNRQGKEDYFLSKGLGRTSGVTPMGTPSKRHFSTAGTFFRGSRKVESPHSRGWRLNSSLHDEP